MYVLYVLYYVYVLRKSCRRIALQLIIVHEVVVDLVVVPFIIQLMVGFTAATAKGVNFQYVCPPSICITAYTEEIIIVMFATKYKRLML